jgi:nicotinamidase-related amidase
MTENEYPTEEIIGATHLCVDMQNIFAKGGLWETPWMERVLPTIETIVSRYPERTIFSRFITPQRAQDRPGQWRRYFRRWEKATRQNLRGTELDLVPEMARHVPPAVVIDKPVYSAFAHSQLYDLLVGKGIGTIVVSGAETDVCVLATVLSAVDFGFRVVIVEDALCSSSDEGHDALMTMYRTRLHEQIDVVQAKELFDLWHPG